MPTTTTSIHHHHHRSNYRSIAIIFFGSYLLILQLTIRAGYYSSQHYYSSVFSPVVVASFSFSPSTSTIIPSSKKLLASTKYYDDQRKRRNQLVQINGHQQQRHYTIQSSLVIHYSSSSQSEFPSQEYHQDPEEDEDSPSNNNFQRRNFDQRNSRVGSIPSNRQEMMNMKSSNSNDDHDDDDDEWESYLDMDIETDHASPSKIANQKREILDVDVSMEPSNGMMASSDYNGNNANEMSNSSSSRSTNTKQSPRVEVDATTRRRSSDSFQSSLGNSGEVVVYRDIPATDVDFRNNQFISNNDESPEESPPEEDDSAPHLSNQRTTQQRQPQSRQRQRITTEQISQIKSSISLVDAIESYNLPDFTRTSSSSYSSNTAKACCPFHDDTNPSMSIDDNRGLYKCFSCGAGGDIYNFIREYDYLENNRKSLGKEKMGYMQAVEYAAREFGDASLDVGDWSFYFGGGGGDGGKFDGLSEETKEKIRERERKKDRIRQANTAAAAFYTKCLVTLPTAGKARAHLRERHISPESTRTFTIGYAPDCYYGDEKKKKTLRNDAKWGDGSLVEYLAESGFSPDEIVEAGLAVRTKRKQQIQLNSDENSQSIQAKDSSDAKGKDGKETSNNKDTEDENVVDHDYSGLMDRFRSRLIIPIMDDSGQNVIALGGRILEAAADDDGIGDDEENEKPSFIPAKYINSPDSLVFTKKNVLFNKHRAKVAMEDVSTSSSSANKSSSSSTTTKEGSPATMEKTFKAPPAVVIVEGYFDAIALSNVGVRNVVASMGTALPLEQLKIAAEMGNVPGGRIILCMDGDDAGKNAVVRLCSSNILSNVPELNRNELYVATLPGGGGEVVKDPSDYVDFAGGGDKAGERFQEEVLDSVIPCDEWYVAHLLSKYDADAKDGTDGSFASICDEVSTFLATFSNPADRTRRVHNIAEMLVGIIAEDDDTERSSSSLGMLRVQLESDILNMASRKAGVREAIERRIEQTDGVLGEAAALKMERLTRGGDVDMNDGDEKMSRNALASENQPPIREARQIPASRSQRPVSQKTRTRSFRTTQQSMDLQLPERHLVPHFNGFTFKHQSDRDWLGTNGKTKPKMHLGETPTPVEEKYRLRAETPIFEEDYKPNRKKEDVVYFNSNQYLGEQYLTPDAIRAGYSLGDDRPSDGQSIVEFAEKKLFQSDPDQLILQAEDRLLHALAKFPQARAAMRTVYSTNTFGPSNMRWTSEFREWLFLCLTGSPEIDPPLPVELLDGGTTSQLHSYLAKRQDCPDNAFNRDIALESTNGMSADGIIETTVDSSSDDFPETNANWSAGDEPENTLDDESQQVEVIDSEEDESEASAKNGDIGLLDEYFLETDMFPSFTNSSIAKETRAELTVQETVAVILRATAMKRFSTAKSKLTKVISEMECRDDADDEEDGNQPNDNDDFTGVSSEELQELFRMVGNEVVDAQKSLYDSERATDRVNSHLLDYSVSNGVRYKQSQAQLDRLDKMMDDHIASLPEDSHRPTTPGNDGEYMFGSDDFDAEIDPMFGGKNPDEYVVRGLPNGESKWD